MCLQRNQNWFCLHICNNNHLYCPHYNIHHCSVSVFSLSVIIICASFVVLILRPALKCELPSSLHSSSSTASSHSCSSLPINGWLKLFNLWFFIWAASATGASAAQFWMMNMIVISAVWWSVTLDLVIYCKDCHHDQLRETAHDLTLFLDHLHLRHVSPGNTCKHSIFNIPEMIHYWPKFFTDYHPTMVTLCSSSQPSALNIPAPVHLILAQNIYNHSLQ